MLLGKSTAWPQCSRAIFTATTFMAKARKLETPTSCGDGHARRLPPFLLKMPRTSESCSHRWASSCLSGHQSDAARRTRMLAGASIAGAAAAGAASAMIKTPNPQARQSVLVSPCLPKPNSKASSQCMCRSVKLSRQACILGA